MLKDRAIVGRPDAEGAEEVQNFGQVTIGSTRYAVVTTTQAPERRSTLDDALRFILSRTNESFVVLGQALSPNFFDAYRWVPNPPPAAAITPVVEVQTEALLSCVAVRAPEGVRAYFPADIAAARTARWVEVPGCAAFYALPNEDQAAHRNRWLERLDAAGTGRTRAQLALLSMPALRILLAQFAERAFPVQAVQRGTPPQDRGGVVNGATKPWIRLPLSEPECYLAVTTQVEGRMESINAWDAGAGISLGPIQFNVQGRARDPQHGTVFPFLWDLLIRDKALFEQELRPLDFAMEFELGGPEPSADDHFDLLVGTGTTRVRLHGRGGASDVQRNVRFFQSGTPGATGFDPVFRRNVAGRFRNLVAWPHVQQMILERSTWWLEPGLQMIRTGGVPVLNPQDPDRDTFILTALLMSAFVRFSGCLQPLLGALRPFRTPAAKLANWRTAVRGLRAPCPELEARLTAQEGHARDVHRVLRRLAGRPAEWVAPSDSGREGVSEEIVAGLDERAADGVLLREIPGAHVALPDGIGATDLRVVADIYDGLATAGRPDLRSRWGDVFEVIGAPGGTITAPLLPGDVLVRRARGEGSLARLSVVPSGELSTETELASVGLQMEARGPGLYVQVIEAGPQPRRLADAFARRVADPLGRIGADQLVLRSRQARGAGEDSPLAEQPRPRAAPIRECQPEGRLLLEREVIDALSAARRLSGLPLRSESPVCLPVALCDTLVADAKALHHEGHAADVARLDKDSLRMAQLAGLFGVDLTAVRGNKALAPVKTMPREAPFNHLGFWALRQEDRRELHVNLTTLHLFGRRARVVTARVDGQPWACLPFQAAPGTIYTLFKLRYNIASLHRQWGRAGAIAWITGLCDFYRDQNGGLRLGVGDVSHIVGEEMADDHRGHQQGRDIDLCVLEYLPGVLPRAFFCEGTGQNARVSAFTTPQDATGVYGAPLQALTAEQAAVVLRRYASVLAYCLATWPQVELVLWHCFGAVQQAARDIALAAFDAGWQARWGRGPANRPGILTAFGQFNTKMIVDAGHRDHVHVKLISTV